MVARHCEALQPLQPAAALCAEAISCRCSTLNLQKQQPYYCRGLVQRHKLLRNASHFKRFAMTFLRKAPFI